MASFLEALDSIQEPKPRAATGFLSQLDAIPERDVETTSAPVTLEPSLPRDIGSSVARGAVGGYQSAAEGMYRAGAGALEGFAAANEQRPLPQLEAEAEQLRQQTMRPRLGNVAVDVGVSTQLADLERIIQARKAQVPVEETRTGPQKVAGAIGSAFSDFADESSAQRQTVRKALPVSQEFEQSIPGALAEGVGQLASLPLYAVPGAGQAVTAAQLYQEGYDDAVNNGATPEVAQNAARQYLLMAAPLEVLTDKLIVGKAIKAMGKRPTIGEAIKEIAKVSTAGAASEGGQQVALNEVARELSAYQPNRPLTDDVWKSALVGGLVAGIGTGVAQVAGSLSAPIKTLEPSLNPQVNATENQLLAESAAMTKGSNLDRFLQGERISSETQPETGGGEKGNLAGTVTGDERFAPPVEQPSQPINVTGEPTVKESLTPEQPLSEPIKPGEPNAQQNTQTTTPDGNVLNAEGTPPVQAQVSTTESGARVSTPEEIDGLRFAPPSPKQQLAEQAALNTKESSVLENPPLNEGQLQEEARTNVGDAAAEILNVTRVGPSQTLGIASPLPHRADIPVTGKEIQSLYPSVEKRWKQARISSKPVFGKIAETMGKVKSSITRPYFAQNLNPATDGQFIEWMRQFVEVPQWARTFTQNILTGLINPLGQKGYEVYSRNIILADLVKDIQEGLYEGKKLPFGYQSPQEVKSDFAHFQQLATKFSEVQDALNKRQKMQLALRDQLVERGLLDERVQNFDDYYRHQVLEYYNAERQAGLGNRADRRKFGWQKERTGSDKDYNTDYLIAEAEYLSQAFGKIRALDMLARLKVSADISPVLKVAAKDEGVSVDSLIPDDFIKWSPTPGNVFYWTKTLPEKVLDSYFELNEAILPQQVRDTLSVGGKRDEWIIPKNLASDLENLKPKDDGIVSSLARKVNSGWKYWTLLNPTRALKYNLNNLSGDADAMMAYDPAILKIAPGIAKEIFPMFSGQKPFSPELIELTQKGVLSSGITAQEVESISDSRWFRFLKGSDLNPVRRYFSTVEDATNFREAVFRVAAYRRFLERLRRGDQDLVAASDRKIIEDIPNIEDKAARLARELVGDYGAISAFGRYMRERLYPFWSWKEINTKRYWRLFANAPGEGIPRGKIAAQGGARIAGKTALRVAQAAALYGILNMWNNLFFPDEEKELGDEQRRQLHLILGRDSEGNIRTLRVQGAFSDFLGWVGLEDAPSDIRELIQGEKGAGEMFKEGWEAFAGQIVNGSVPLIKATGEALTQKSLYPNPFEPRPIRDPAAHLADLYSVGGIYRKLADIPTPGGTKGMLSNLIFYTADPGQSAYYETRNLVAAFLQKEGIEASGGEPTDRSNALYYYKQSLRYGDRVLADKWLNQYFALGGTPEGMKKSIQTSNPLGRLQTPATPSKRREQAKRNPDLVALRKKFESTLTPAQKATIDRAEQWYHKVYQADNNFLLRKR